MAAAKKGKKTSKTKKATSNKKKGNNVNFFSKLMLILLTVAVIIIAVFLTLSNFNINKDKTHKAEVSIKYTEKETKDTEKVTSRQNKDKVTPIPEEEKQQTPVTEVKEENKQQEKIATDLKNEVKEAKVLNGCWLSSEQGASLTIDEYGYRIDFFNVDASKPITGDYRFDKNLIIFNSDGDVCSKIEGSYRITFYKNNFSLICKDDDCSIRRNILEADWEWMEL